MSYPTAYTNIPSPGNPRETEAWALTEAARRIAEGQRKDDNNALLDAVRLNWRLWTLFQSEIASQDSSLPRELRQNMLSLCNFVDKTTVEIIADPAPQKADILVTINRHLAAGLFSVAPSSDLAAAAAEDEVKVSSTVA